MLYIDPLSTPFIQNPFSRVDESLKEKTALQELEHYFIYMLLQEMRKSVGSAAGISASRETSMFQELLDDTLSGVAAQSGQLGLAAQLAAQLHIADVRQQAIPNNK